jgi:hypothetical protein
MSEMLSVSDLRLVAIAIEYRELHVLGTPFLFCLSSTDIAFIFPRSEGYKTRQPPMHECPSRTSICQYHNLLTAHQSESQGSSPPSALLIAR